MQNPAMKINEERKNRGMSIKYLSDKTGIPYSVLQPCLSCRRELRVNEYFAVCDFLGLDPNTTMRA